MTGKTTTGATLIEMGHAYGKAKFYGTCKLTGLAIVAGNPIRHLAFEWSDGGKFDGYVPLKAAEAMDFRGGSEGPSTTGWRRGTCAIAELDLAACAPGTSIEILRNARGAYATTTDRWVLIDGKWKNMATRGSSSHKQLAASFAKLNPANVVASRVRA